MSNVFQQFNQFAAQALDQGLTAEQVNAERLRLFKQVVIPAMKQKGHKTAGELQQAAKIWNEATDSALRDLGFLNTDGESGKNALERRDMTRRGRAGGLSLAAGAAGSAANDIGVGLKRGTLRALGFGARFANDLGENEKGTFLDNFANAMNEGATNELENASQGYRDAIKGGVFGSGRGFGIAGLESLPNVMLPLGVGKVAASAAGALGANAGIRAGVGGLAAFGTRFTQNYGAVREGSETAMRDSVTPEMLRVAEKSREMFGEFEQEGYKSGLTGQALTDYAYNKTIDQLSEDKATDWGLIMTALEPIAMGASTILARSGGGKYLGQKAAERAMGIGAGNAAMRAAVQNEGKSGIRQALSLGSARADAGMVGRQALEESLQGGVEAYAGQDAAAELGGTPVDWGKVGTNAAAEGILGGIMGGGMQVASGNSPSRIAQQQLGQLRQQHQSQGQLFTQLAQGAQAAQMAGDTQQFNDLMQEANAQANAVRVVEQQMKDLGIPFESVLPQVDPTAQPTPQPDVQPTVDPMAEQQGQPQPANLDEAISQSMAGFQPPQNPQAQPDPAKSQLDEMTRKIAANAQAEAGIEPSPLDLAVANITGNQPKPRVSGLTGIAQRAQQNAPAPAPIAPVVDAPVVAEPTPQDSTQLQATPQDTPDSDFISQYVANGLAGDDAANQALLREKAIQGVTGDALLSVTRKARRELNKAKKATTQAAPQNTENAALDMQDQAIQAPPIQQPEPVTPPANNAKVELTENGQSVTIQPDGLVQPAQPQVNLPERERKAKIEQQPELTGETYADNVNIILPSLIREAKQLEGTKQQRIQLIKDWLSERVYSDRTPSDFERMFNEDGIADLINDAYKNTHLNAAEKRALAADKKAMRAAKTQASVNKFLTDSAKQNAAARAAEQSVDVQPVSASPVKPVKVKSVGMGFKNPDYDREIAEPARQAVASGNSVKYKDFDLVMISDGDDQQGAIVALDKNGDLAGSVDYVKVEEEDGTRHNPSVYVAPKHRREGLASEMYRVAEEYDGAKIPAIDQAGQARTDEGQAFRVGMDRKRKGLPPLPKPEPYRLKPVRTYRTKAGKIGAEVKESRDAKGRMTYAYMGEWGAGSVDADSMRQLEAEWRATKRGYTVEKVGTKKLSPAEYRKMLDGTADDLQSLLSHMDGLGLVNPADMQKAYPDMMKAQLPDASDALEVILRKNGLLEVEPARPQAGRLDPQDPNFSQAIDDFTTGRRSDVPSIEEVEAEKAAKPKADTVLDQFADNKIFTADKVAAARERLRKKLNQLNSGIDPELLVDGMMIAGAYIESGTRKFSDYAQKMIGDMGDNIKPYLLSFWEGARNYPNLDTTGMTDPTESKRLFDDLNKVVTEEMQPVVGEKAKLVGRREKKTGKPADRALRQDWGVDRINGWAESDEFPDAKETDEGLSDGVKDAFLMDAKQYLKNVAIEMESLGYVSSSRFNKKGKIYLDAISVSRGGVAVAGDVIMMLRHVETGTYLYVSIGETSLRGMTPHTKQGVAILFRASGHTNDDYARRDTRNNWSPVALTASELSKMLDQHVQRVAANKPVLPNVDDGLSKPVDVVPEPQAEATTADSKPTKAEAYAQIRAAAMDKGRQKFNELPKGWYTQESGRAAVENAVRGSVYTNRLAIPYFTDKEGLEQILVDTFDDLILEAGGGKADLGTNKDIEQAKSRIASWEKQLEQATDDSKKTYIAGKLLEEKQRLENLEYKLKLDAGATEQQAKTTQPNIVTHTTTKGKELRGIVRTDLSAEEAKAIDPYTFKKDDGYFIRESRLNEQTAEQPAPIPSSPEQPTDTDARIRKGIERAEADIARLTKLRAETTGDVSRTYAGRLADAERDLKAYQDKLIGDSRQMELEAMAEQFPSLKRARDLPELIADGYVFKDISQSNPSAVKNTSHFKRDDSGDDVIADVFGNKLTPEELMGQIDALSSTVYRVSSQHYSNSKGASTDLWIRSWIKLTQDQNKMLDWSKSFPKGYADYLKRQAEVKTVKAGDYIIDSSGNTLQVEKVNQKTVRIKGREDLVPFLGIKRAEQSKPADAIDFSKINNGVEVANAVINLKAGQKVYDHRGNLIGTVLNDYPSNKTTATKMVKFAREVKGEKYDESISVAAFTGAGEFVYKSIERRLNAQVDTQQTETKPDIAPLHLEWRDSIATARQYANKLISEGVLQRPDVVNVWGAPKLTELVAAIDAALESQSVAASEPAKPDPVAAMRAGKMRVHLNQPIKTADGDITTIGKLIDLKISKGGRPVEISKRDSAAEKRLMSEFESLVRNAPIGNSNHPDTIRLNELKAMRKDPSQFRDGEFIVKTPDYRLESADGTGDMVLTKTGFDYAQSVVANISAPVQTEPTATQESTNEPTKLGQPSPRTLEGVPADSVQGTEGERPTGSRATESRRDDLSGNGRTGESGLQRTRSMGDGAPDVPVSGGGVGAGSVRSERSGGRAPQADVRQSGGDNTLAVVPAPQQSDDFALTEQDKIGSGGAKTKFKGNVEAIRILKAVVAEGRKATREEQRKLAKFVGWGGLQQAFRRDDGSVANGWAKEVDELENLLTPDEYKAAVDSSIAAHYTSPEIVKGIWDAVKQLGFTGGRVLEPSMGSGNFFGMMPKDLRKSAQLHGVELDNITGHLAQQLYPEAKIKVMGFQDYAIPDGHFDLAIGNPPFGAIKITDASRPRISGLSLHNYFFAKSVDALAENGVLAMVVTNNLLDASNANDRARQYMAERTEFLGAIRLPNNAFAKNAGTEVTTDIVFLRKLTESERMEGAKGHAWVSVRPYTDKNGKQVPLNEYFHKNPSMMLGEFGAYGSMYSPEDPALVAREGQNTPELMAQAIAKLPKAIMADRGQQKAEAQHEQNIADIPNVKVGSMFVQDGQVYVRQPDQLGERQAEPVEMPSAKALDRVTGMTEIRDALNQLRLSQLSDDTSPESIEADRAALNKAYDAFVKRNGYLNSDANKRLFRDDPSWPQLSSLEDGFDKGISAAVSKNTGEQVREPSAKKAAIFQKRTQFPYTRIESVSNAKDGMVESLNRLGQLDIGLIAQLYGKDEQAVIRELGDLIYQDPVYGWVTADEYLSGNVKKKLAQAKDAVASGEDLQRNVEALEKVQPADIEAVDIEVRAGSHWIPSKHVVQFIKDTLAVNSATAHYNNYAASWDVTTSAVPESSQTSFGTIRANAVTILIAALNGKQITIYDQLPENKTEVNAEATAAANEKVEQVKRAWSDWIWKDDARRVELARIYNDTFNTTVQQRFNGAHLSLLGKVDDAVIKLKPHQADAVWRITQTPTALLDHVVGAGKTFTMIGAIMELRRMGKSTKPMLVVPNHLVGQWAADFQKLYPSANILAANKKDFEKNNRKRLFARIATGDWDAVIVAHSSFGKVPLSPEEEAEFTKAEIKDMMDAEARIRSESGKDSRNAKDIAKRRMTLEEKLKKLMAEGRKDNDNLYWHELGVDSVFVDEAHEFKNLAFSSGMQRVAGLGNQKGSQKAFDLSMKIKSIKNRIAGSKIVFATGTPISNTMAEMYTMQRYLDLDAMQEQGLGHFDAWAKMFGQVVSDWELSPAGKYKMNSRFAKFVNMPELMQRYLSFADVINRDDINRQLAAIGQTLGTPKIKGDKPQNIVVERSDDQAGYIGEPIVDKDGNETYPEGTLVHRAENLPKKAEKGADNMLKIMSDARKAALDMRLIDPSLPDYEGSKTNEAVRRAVEIYKKWDADKGTQLIFCDLSTPKGAAAGEKARIEELIRLADQGDEEASEQLDKLSPDELDALNSNFSVYDDIKAKLIKSGIPEKEIAFIHDAKTEPQKEELFGKVKSGRIRILLGSTSKMGAGTNVQDRLVALHHLDAPWRPSDLEQREGRIIRQGNEFYKRDPEGFEIEILRYATKQTLDSRMWQTLESKARFIEQVRKGDVTSRVIEDVGGEAANAAEMKAASSGNPLILEEMSLRRELQNLESEKSRHNREQHRIKDTIRSLLRDQSSHDRNIEELSQDVSVRVPEKFEITIGKKTFKQGQEGARDQAGELLKEAAIKSSQLKQDFKVGSYGDFDLFVQHYSFSRDSVEFVAVSPATGRKHSVYFAIGSDSPTGLITKIGNRLRSIPDMLKAAEDQKARDLAEIPKLESQLKDWSKADELEAKREQHKSIIDQLKPKQKPEKSDVDSATGADQEGQTDIRRSVAVWHGSPYQFERFSLEHLGRGEGAQAFGWGLYFAGNRAVAEHYKNVLGSKSYNLDSNRGLSRDLVMKIADTIYPNLLDGVFEVKSVVTMILAAIEDGTSYADEAKQYEKNYPETAAAYYDLGSRISHDGNSSKLYRVRLQPDESDFLSLDEPLSEQKQHFEKLKPLLDRLSESDDLARYEDKFGQIEGWTGGELIKALNEAAMDDLLPYDNPKVADALDEGNSPKAVSMYLHSLGIAGNRYLDGMSRGKDRGHQNYVLFDDSAAEIIEAYNSKDTQPQRPANAGQTVEQVRNLLTERFGADVIAKMEANGKLVIVQSDAALAKEYGTGIEGFYDPATDQTTLVADNLTPRTVIPTLLHEMGGHAGFQTVMRPETYAAIMQQFDKMVEAGNPLAVRAKQRAERAESNPATQRDEYLPYLITEASIAQDKKGGAYQAVMRLIDRAVAAVRAWAFDKLGVRLKLNPNDIVALAERMVKQAADPKVASKGRSNADARNSINPSAKSLADVRKQHEGKPTWMKAPNGKPTNLTERQWLQVRTPEFKAWFGDWENDPANASKVIDANGEPMVVYHASPNKDITVFDRRYKIDKLRDKDGVDSIGSWFSDNRDFATYLYGKNVYEAFLSLKDPIEYDSWAELMSDWRETHSGATARKKSNKDAMERFKKNNHWGGSDLYREEILGYSDSDGFVLKAHGDKDSEWHNQTAYVVAEPTQIKSATDNTGDFDGSNPDIRFSEQSRSRIDMHFKDVVKRTPELQEAAKKLQAGEITAADYDRLVDKYKPVEAYTSVPKPATREDLERGLTSEKVEKIGIPSQTLEDGYPVGLRLDIPAYSNHGVWVVSVHEQQSGFAAGKSIGYESVAIANNATFGVVQNAALNIAGGKPKATIAVMKGDWVNTTPDEAYQAAVKALKSDQWVQVGMDPERHSYFYDRANMRPVESAEQIIQVGALVMAKNPVYGDKTAYRFSRRDTEADAVRRQHEGKPTWMKAPNGLRTNLTEQQWLQVRTPEFKAWFGDWENDPANASKVIDKNGEPMVVYHGSRVAGFTEFDENSDMYFTDRFDVAATYGSFDDVELPSIDDEFYEEHSGIYSAFIKSNNPMKADFDGEGWFRSGDKPATDDVAQKAKRLGNDGAVIENVVDVGMYGSTSDDGVSTVYVVFDPTQIKSATDNTGDFDGSNPDIRFSRRDTEFEDAPVTPTNFTDRMKRRLREDISQGYPAHRASEFIRRWLGTPLHLSLTEPQFKPVFTLIQERLNHVSAEASHAIEVAPEILGRRETFADFRAEVKNAGSMIMQGKYTQDMQAAAKVLFDGTLIDKKVYSDAELTSKGLTADQVKRYREMRAAINTSLNQSAKAHMSKLAMFEEVFTGEEIHRLHDQDLSVPRHREQIEAKVDAALKALDPKKQEDKQQIKRLNEARKKIGDIDNRLGQLKEEGYAPLMRFGQHDLRVVDSATGDTVLYEMFETKRERDRARDSLIEANLLGDKYEMTTKTKNPEEYKLFREQGINPETFALFSKVAGLDSDQAYQAYLKLATAPQSAMRRLIHRKGIAGFSENTDRVMAAFVISNARRSANMLYSQDIESAVMKIDDGELQGYAQKLVAYINDPVEEMAALRSFLFFMNMGFSLRYGLLNLTQPYIQTLPELTRYVPAGRATKIVTSSSGTALKSMSDDSAIPAEFQDDYKMLKRKGFLEPQNIWALQGRERGRSATTSVWDVVLHSSGIIAQFTETVNRRTAMISALRTAKIMGADKLKAEGFDSAYDFAAHVIQSTQGVMNKGNRPQAARGLVGAPLFVFRTFSIQYVEQMIRMIKNPQYAGERDELRKALLLLMLILFGLAGATGLPFAKDLLDIFETGMALSGNPVNFEREVQQVFGKEMAEPILYGAVNGFVFDMHGSTSMGDLLPATRMFHPDTSAARGLLEIGGATGGFLNKMGDSGALMMQGKVGDGVVNALPRFATSIGQGTQIATTGEFRTQYGNKLTDGTAMDAVLKIMDMNPSGLAQQGRTRMLEREDVAIRDDAQKKFRNRLIEAYEDGDQAKIREIRADIADWNKDNPQYPVKIDYNRSIKPAIQRRNETWQERGRVPEGMEWMQDLRPD